MVGGVRWEQREVNCNRAASRIDSGSFLGPSVSTTPAVPVAKLAIGVIDTGGKFATGVVDTGGKFAVESLTQVATFSTFSLIPVVHLDLCILFLCEFLKKL